MQVCTCMLIVLRRKGLGTADCTGRHWSRQPARAALQSLHSSRECLCGVSGKGKERPQHSTTMAGRAGCWQDIGAKAGSAQVQLQLYLVFALPLWFAREITNRCSSPVCVGPVQNATSLFVLRTSDDPLPELTCNSWPVVDWHGPHSFAFETSDMCHFGFDVQSLRIILSCLVQSCRIV